ncbi:phosphoglycerate mutase family protein [Kineococcus sp. NBC_00420]|uniref:histidine phosphatase family protein n=1 Tax=Kineococcus sp. NBC_00420 TaxID=2903564 RepID=UPI002E1C72FB
MRQAEDRRHLIFIRHGQSLHSQRQILAGVANCPGLTPHGRTQAHDLATQLLQICGAPDAIDSSPVARARETAEIVRETLALNLPIDDDARLSEPSPGTADGLSLIDYEAQFGTFDMQTEPDRLLAPGGESWRQFLARVDDFVAERSIPDGTHCRWIFTHAGFMVWLVRSLVGATATRLRLEFENCSMLHFEVSDGHWILRSYLPPDDVS